MIDFQLPSDLSAQEPPEVRGSGRDDVRLMVSSARNKTILHTAFRNFPDFLKAGDVLVVNTSATINASLPALRPTSGATEAVRVHLSTPISNRRWVIELRRVTAQGTEPLLDAQPEERIQLLAGGDVTLLAPFVRDGNHAGAAPIRLWVGQFSLPSNVLAYANEHGSPIRYNYVTKSWPLSHYQTIFSSEPGSVEMASAGRAFTPEVVERLEAKGVTIARIVLHSGVASLEANEPPYPERYRVSETAADAVNRARSNGGRVIAVGTTVVRALETVASNTGEVHSDSGWTHLHITPERGLFAVDGLLTGLHAPRASHLAMLEAFAGREYLTSAYQEAVRNRYLWHEFGDLHLILPDTFSTPTHVRRKRIYATC